MPILWRLILNCTLSLGGVTAVACNSSVIDPADVTRFVQAEARWHARPFADYSYEIRIFCFCPPEMNRWTRVSVRNEVVADAQAVEPDPNFPVTTLSYWQPVDSLFTSLRRAMSESGLTSYLESIVVDYDPVLGYPTNIEYRARSTVADGGATYSLRNVLPLP
jgi:Family of unknown function (DUF6174)